MDLSVNPVSALERVAAALAEAMGTAEGDANAETNAAAAGAPTAVEMDTATALARGGFVERILGETQTTAAANPAEPPGTRVDKNVETTNLQTFARPHAAVAEPARSNDSVLPSGTHSNVHGGSDFAVPAALLVPVTLTGLHVEQVAAWPLPGRGFDPDPASLHRVRGRDQEHAPPPAPLEEEPEEEHDEAAPGQDKNDDDAPTCGVVFQDEDDGSWCDELTQVLRRALAAKVPPLALLAAAEQWRRGRCVVLACPQHADPAGPAWAFVLWPRKQVARKPDAAAAPLTLFGLRVEARLQWSTLVSRAQWWQVRVIKQHHPRSGRQLICADTTASTARVPCEVQLGPVLARTLRCCDVCLRIGAAQRFWTALGTQWSMHVIVSSKPLIGAGTPPAMEDIPC